MSVRKKRSQVQGSADGLCGIYCLVHFLERVPKLSEKKKSTKAKSAFYALLKSAESLKSDEDARKLLSAEKIADGYYSGDLIQIFNETASRKRLGFRAYELEDVAEELDENSSTGLLKTIFKQGGGAIVHVFGVKHWVLAHALGVDGAILVKDSGHDEAHRKDELKRAPSSLDGVALVPAHSNISRLMKNA